MFYNIDGNFFICFPAVMMIRDHPTKAQDQRLTTAAGPDHAVDQEVLHTAEAAAGHRTVHEEPEHPPAPNAPDHNQVAPNACVHQRALRGYCPIATVSQKATTVTTRTMKRDNA